MWDILYTIFKVWLGRFSYDKYIQPNITRILKFMDSIKLYFILLLKREIAKTKETIKQAIDFLMMVSNHPFYNKMAIGFNYFFLYFSFILGAVLAAAGVLNGVDLSRLFIVLSVYFIACIGYFSLMMKLYL